MLIQEGVDTIILAKFYWYVVQAVLLFGAETWVLLVAMLKKLEGVHVGFLQHTRGMKAQRLGDAIWKKEGQYRVLQAAGTEPLREYIDKRQEAVAEWVDLRTIFEVYKMDLVYAGGGRLRELWWHQKAAEKQLGARLKKN